LAPARELANQIAFVIAQLGDIAKIKVHACVGGTAIRDEIVILKKGVHVVVGTPGRVLDMMKKGFLKPDYLKMMIMDEADMMLSKGFREQIQEIVHFVPSET
jgi:translation initiation factor 4A